MSVYVEGVFALFLIDILLHFLFGDVHLLRIDDCK
jgi:hypothetical protein